MKKFIVVSLMSVMGLGMIASPTQTQNLNLQNLKSADYSTPKDNSKENFVRFQSFKIQDTENEKETNIEKNDEKDNQKTDFSDDITTDELDSTRNMYYNGLNNNWNNAMPFNNGLNGYGYNGPNAMGYGYNGNFYNNPNNLNTYNLPTYTPSRSNLNTYGIKQEEKSNNLDEYFEDNKNNNDEKSQINQNNNAYEILKQTENDVFTPNNDKLARNNYQNQTASKNQINNVSNSTMQNIDAQNRVRNEANNNIENNLYNLIIDVKNLCMDSENYSNVNTQFNQTRSQLLSKIERAKDLIQKIEQNNININGNERQNDILDKANKIGDKLNAIMDNYDNQIGFGDYGFRLNRTGNRLKPISYYELYDTMQSNQSIYNEINAELDSLINDLEFVYSNKTQTNNQQTQELNNTNNLQNDNQANITPINEKNNINTNQTTRTINNETNNTEINNLTTQQDSNINSNNTNNNSNTNSNNTNNNSNTNSNNNSNLERKNESKINVSNNQSLVAEKPEPNASGMKENNISTREKLENRKETINKLLDSKSNNDIQKIKYKNPYEPNNNPLN